MTTINSKNNKEEDDVKEKIDFISSIVHQLRTPLSTIKWSLEMILNGDIGEITSEQRDILDKTYKTNERMISLVEDILNVAKIKEEKYFSELTLINLELIVQFVINFYRDAIKSKNIKFEFQKPEKELPKILVNVDRIKMAIQALFDNAIKYTLPNGSITVALKTIENKIIFSIKDTGIGILSGQQKKIFTKFFRGTNALKIEQNGSGLGLFMVKSIIEWHGGELWFESCENKGSTFYFSLPIPRKK